MVSDALAAGITRLDEVLYVTTKHREYQFQARELAMDIAKEKAGHLAEMNGLKLGKPIRIEISLQGGRGTGWNLMRRAAVGRAKVHLVSMAAETRTTPRRSDKRPVKQQPIAPGLISIQCTVKINFEMIE